MKKLNFWGFIKLAITIIKLYKDHREELLIIFNELKKVIEDFKKGEYRSASVNFMAATPNAKGVTNKSVNLTKVYDIMA